MDEHTYKICASDLNSYANDLIYNTDNKFCDLSCSLFANDERYKAHILVFNSGNRKHRIINEVVHNVSSCKHKIFSNRSNSVSKILGKMHDVQALILIGEGSGDGELISSSCIMLDNLFAELDNLVSSIDSDATNYELKYFLSHSKSISY